MRALLNIGADRKDAAPIRWSEVQAQLIALDVSLIQEKLWLGWRNDEEDTYVLHVDNIDEDKVFTMSERLGQEAIALYDMERARGSVIGPKWQLWGSFDSDKFHLL